MTNLKAKEKSQKEALECTFVSYSPILSFVIIFVATIATVSPSVAGGDSGELLAEGCTLGTPHPPGYPTYMLLTYAVASVVKYFGRSNVAYYMNLTSCLFGALTSAFMTKSIILLADDAIEGFLSGEDKTLMQVTFKRHTGSGGIRTIRLMSACSAVTASLMCSFCPLLWLYSTTSEVFAMNNVFVSSIVCLCLMFGRERKKEYIYVGAFLCGLSLTNQHTSILLEIPIVTWVFFECKMYQNFKLIFQVVICFLCGLIPPYMALISFARSRPHAGSWGDLNTLSGFLNHFRRKDYGTFTLFSGNDNEAESALTRSILWFNDFNFQSNKFIAALLLLTCLMVLIRHFSLNSSNSKGKGYPQFAIHTDLLLTAALIFYLIVFHALSNLPLHQKLLYGVHQRFWMQPNILAFILVGYGLFLLCLMVSRIQTVVLFLVMLVSISFRKGYTLSNQSDNYFFHNYARGILDSIPPNSLLFINYDQQWTSIRYMQECEQLRPDITSINLSMMSYKWFETKQSLYPNITFPGTHYTQISSAQWYNGGFSFTELLENNFDVFKGNIFIGGNLNYDNEHLKSFDEVPYGMTRQFVRLADLPGISPESYRHKSSLAWKVIGRYHKNLPHPRRYGQDTWEWTIGREFYSHWIARGTYLLDLVVKEISNESSNTALPSLIESTMWLEYARLADTTEYPSASMLKNLGLAYLHIVRTSNSKFISDDVSNSFTALKVGNIDMSEVLSGTWIDRANNINDVKSWASSRWNLAWKQFLSMADAKSDPSFEQVKSIYEQVKVIMEK